MLQFRSLFTDISASVPFDLRQDYFRQTTFEIIERIRLILPAIFVVHIPIILVIDVWNAFHMPPEIHRITIILHSVLLLSCAIFYGLILWSNLKSPQQITRSTLMIPVFGISLIVILEHFYVWLAYTTFENAVVYILIIFSFSIIVHLPRLRYSVPFYLLNLLVFYLIVAVYNTDIVEARDSILTSTAATFLAWLQAQIIMYLGALNEG